LFEQKFNLVQVMKASFWTIDFVHLLILNVCILLLGLLHAVILNILEYNKIVVKKKKKRFGGCYLDKYVI